MTVVALESLEWMVSWTRSPPTQVQRQETKMWRDVKEGEKGWKPTLIAQKESQTWCWIHSVRTALKCAVQSWGTMWCERFYCVCFHDHAECLRESSGRLLLPDYQRGNLFSQQFKSIRAARPNLLCFWHCMIWLYFGHIATRILPH